MSDVRRLVEGIHASPVMAVVAVSGAGSRALSWLFDVPGASRTVLEAIVPYSRTSMVEFLGHEPADYVSVETALAMARAAYARALRLREGGGPVVGLGCTATIATERPKRGDHRCSVAVSDGASATVYGLTLTKGARDRGGEEAVVSRLVLHALADACGVPSQPSLDLVEGERLDVRHIEAGAQE